MKCTICNKESDKLAKVTYRFLNDADSWTSYYCVFFNKDSNRFQILHKGVIAETRKASDGNIRWVEITNIGY